MNEQEEQKQQSPVKLATPESISQYDDIMTPEIEIKQTKLFITDNEIPKDLKQRFWGIVDKQSMIGNLNDEEILAVDNKEDLAISWHFMGVPRWEITFDDLFFIEQLKLKSFKATRRSRHGFERMALVTQKVEQKADITQLQQPVKKKRRFKIF